MRKVILIIIVLFILGISAYRLIVRFSSEGDKAESGFNKIPVKAVAIKQMDMVNKMKFTGSIIGTEVVKVFPQVPGKIHSILIQEGQKVWKDKTLFRINRDIVGMEYKLAVVESPITGYIGKIMVDRGMAVSPNTALCQVVNMTTVEAEIRLMEEDINRVTVGMTANIRVEAFPDRIFIGKVYKKSPVLDERSRTQEVRIKINNKKLALRHGMFADVWIILGERKGVIAVPEDSVIKIGYESIGIYKVENQRAVLQKIITGLTVNNYTEVISGLKRDDIVITLGHENISDGDELIIYREDIDAKSGQGREGL
ncbi:MAG: efflux RND transporter periplasmic adaptor subunit [Spirochaetota bacterium]|nr:efflux RND transporter periplasmic adaptor subunit [Spirochaetota bacterium]